MITPLHDRDGFFKYYTADSAKRTLRDTSRKWSTPAQFNDPFDNQFGLYFEEPSADLVEENLEQFIELIMSAEPLRTNQFGSRTPLVETLRQALRENPDFTFTSQEMADLRKDLSGGVRQVIDAVPAANVEIQRVMADITIFCLSETPDNLLMWSHYAQNHTGAVIKFLSLPEVDSQLMSAQPVRYTTQIPQLKFADFMDFETARKNVLDIITLTKSHVWAYEKEWRVISPLRDKTKSYEIIPYASEEVGAVYLGCKIAEGDKNDIITLTTQKYPKAKIFQAEKHERRFALILTKIL